MGKLIWVAPIFLLAGCSRTLSPIGSVQGNPAAATPPAQAGRQVATIPAGTTLLVRMDKSVSTRAGRAGDSFSASLSAPIEVDGRTVVPAGTQFNGHLTVSKASGRMKGRAVIGLRLDSFSLGDREFHVQTNSVERVSDRHRKHNAVFIAGGTGLGAAIGAIAGGPKGALIGAGAGAGAGTAGAALTGKKQVGVGAETALRFRLEAPLEM